MAIGINLAQAPSSLMGSRALSQTIPSTLEARILAIPKRSLNTSLRENPPSLKTRLIESRRPINHADLTDIVSALYKKNLDGICAGLAIVAIESVLSGNIASFNEKLDALEELFTKHKDDIPAIVESIKADLNLLTFFDKIKLCHDPVPHKNLFQKGNQPTYQSDPKSSDSLLSMIASHALKRKGTLKTTRSFTGVYNQDALVSYLKQFKGICEKLDRNTPIAIKLANSNHTIAIVYDSKNKHWLFIDANQLPIKECKTEKNLAQYIQKGFFNSTTVIMQSKIYYPNEIASSLKNEVTRWFNSSAFKQLHQVTPEKVQSNDYMKTSWLRISSRNGDEKVVKALLQVEANVNDADPNGATALHIASECGHLPVVKTLLKAGANKDAASSKGTTPLHIGAQNGHLPVVKALLLAGANKDAANSNGVTPLHIGTQNGHLPVVKALLLAGANKDAATSNGYTPLKIALHCGHSEIVKILSSP